MSNSLGVTISEIAGYGVAKKEEEGEAFGAGLARV